MLMLSPGLPAGFSDHPTRDGNASPLANSPRTFPRRFQVASEAGAEAVEPRGRPRISLRQVGPLASRHSLPSGPRAWGPRATRLSPQRLMKRLISARACHAVAC